MEERRRNYESMIYHPLWLGFLPIDERKDEGQRTLSLFCYGISLRNSGKERMDNVRTCSPVKVFAYFVLK